MAGNESITEKEHGAKIRTMFDRISRRYDLANRIISAGRDLAWRRHAAALLGDLHGKSVLDLCCGSGDFLAILRKKYGSTIELCGIDFAPRMLELAQKRLAPRSAPILLLCRADALKLPLADESVDAVTIGFGIRNISDRPAALREILRILRPGGKVVMLEPAIPENRIARILFSFYFRWIAPLLGGIITGDRAAYAYLMESTAGFPPPEEFLDMMNTAGYAALKAISQTFGTAMIYYGEKEARKTALPPKR